MLGWALLAIIALVLLVLGPLSWHVLNSEVWNPFQTLRLGLLLIDILLIGTAAGVVAELVLLTGKRRSLR
jgi:hypothetical protein